MKSKWGGLCDEFLRRLDAHDYENVGETAALLGMAHAIVAGVKHGWIEADERKDERIK
jgi:hypothetical protein